MKVSRTFDIIAYSLESHPLEDALNGKNGDQWVKMSTVQFARNVELLALGLLSMGLKKGDRVATVSGNRPEWMITDMALAMIGAVHVPLYSTISDEEYKYIIKHSGAKFIFVSDEKLYRKLNGLKQSIQTLEQIFTFNQVRNAQNIDNLYKTGEDNEQNFMPVLKSIKDSIQEEDLVTIIYTSGTTGTPKGVMLSHRNLVSNFTTHVHNFDFGPSHHSISFLPLCHIFERSVNYNFFYKGIGIYYVETLAQIMPAIREIKPHIFCAVPRLLERIYNGILAKGKQLEGFKKKLFFWAVDLGKNFEYNSKNSLSYSLKLWIADQLIFSKWRKALGGNLKIIVSGGAALQPRIARVFGTAGISILEGYGLTETSPVIAVGNLVTRELMIGTNGPVLPGVEVKIADDGEILTKGPNLMLGYYDQPDLTAEVIDQDGWFHTGDVGTLEEGKYLKITDRKKEIFKLSSGKYIAPQMLENKLKESILIDQVMVVGDHEKFASALISPNFEYLHDWCYENRIHFIDNKELIYLPEIQAYFQKEIKEINKTLGQHEEIKRYRLIPDSWSPQSGELSQTLKLKRKVIESKYKNIIESIFAPSREEI